MLKSVEALAMLPDNSTDIACYSIIDYFTMYHKARTEVGDIPAEQGWPDLCLADFATWYEAVNKKGVLADADGCALGADVNALNLRLHFSQAAVRTRDGTMWTTDKTYGRRATQKILRHVHYDILRDPANHFREQLLLFLPGSHWVPNMDAECNEDEALLLNCTTYLDAYRCHVDEVLERNRAYVFNSSIDWDVLQLTVLNDFEKARQRLDELAQTKRDSHAGAGTCEYDVGVDIREPGMNTNSGGAAVQQQANKMATAEYFQAVDGLNAEQRALFKHIMHTVKHGLQQPFHIFLTGGAGVGKSVLLRCLVQALMRWYDSQPNAKLDLAKVIVMAYTGTAAFNVGGDTIHSTMRFPIGIGLGRTPQLDSQKLQTMRTQFAHMRVVVIDEISFVDTNIMGHIDKRLRTAMDQHHVPFGGLSMLVVGDLFQLPPVRGKWIFQTPSTGVGGLAEGTWNLFKMYELTEIMRQKNRDFAERVNRLRDWDVGATTKHADMEWWINKAKTSHSPPPNTPHLFFKNKLCNEHNAAVLRDMPGSAKTIAASDTVSTKLTPEVATALKARVSTNNNRKETGNLLSRLILKEGSRVGITMNVDKQDGLTNGADGTVCGFVIPEGSLTPLYVLVKFDNPRVGKTLRSIMAGRVNMGLTGLWTPIRRETATFKVGRGKDNDISRTQFPLEHTAARTLHKAQGMTLSSVCLDLRDARPGMHYVAVSRVSDEAGLYFHTPDAFNATQLSKLTFMQGGKCAGCVLTVNSSLRYRHCSRYARTDLCSFTIMPGP